MNLKLTMTCESYDRSAALIDGRVKPKGIDLEVHVRHDGLARQQDAAGGRYDICEFYTGRHIMDLEHGRLGLVAIPVFVKRVFRHSYIYVNRKANIRKPSDLNGKRIGLMHWSNTTALWAKGMLADDWGVDLRSIDWLQAVEDPYPWQAPSWLRLRQIPRGAQLEGMLAGGEVEAVMTTDTFRPFHPDIDFLFPNHAEVERDYFARTRIHPIMHTLVVCEEILREHPWVAMSLYDAWTESRQLCYDWQAKLNGQITSLWFRALWEEERRLVGSDDVYPWGLKKTRHEIAKMLEYAYDQGLTGRLIQPEELYHPSTLGT